MKNIFSTLQNYKLKIHNIINNKYNDCNTNNLYKSYFDNNIFVQMKISNLIQIQYNF